MKNEKAWVPTKYVRVRGVLKASRDPSEVGVGSRLIGDLVARFYDANLREHARGRLVDLGCGKVPLYAAYRESVDEITCVDWAPPSDGTAHLDYVCDLSKPLPLQDAAFETVILSDVLEHVPDPALLWAEMSRITRPGGKLLLNTPFLHCLHEQPHDYFRFTEHALRMFAEQNNFDIVKLEAIGGTPEVLADIVGKHLQFVPLVGKPLSRAVQAVTGWFVSLRVGASASKRTADAFPLGYGLVGVRREGATHTTG